MRPKSQRAMVVCCVCLLFNQWIHRNARFSALGVFKATPMLWKNLWRGQSFKYVFTWFLMAAKWCNCLTKSIYSLKRALIYKFVYLNFCVDLAALDSHFCSIEGKERFHVSMRNNCEVRDVHRLFSTQFPIIAHFYRSHVSTTLA